MWFVLNYPYAMEDFSQIVTNWFVSLRNPFINYIHKALPVLGLDEIEDIYSEVFIKAIRKILMEGNVASGTKWKAYIFKIGYNMAVNKAKQSSRFIQAIESTSDDDIDDNNRFETYISLKDVVEEEDNETKIQRIAILEREIRYLPEPCETILKDFYYGGLSMNEIMDEIHYQSTNSVKVMKNRCMKKLKERIKLALDMLNKQI